MAYGQCPDLTLPVQGDDVCVNDYATVTIENTESGVYYQAFKDGNRISGSFMGNGNDLNIIIPAVQLSTGANTIHFKAFKNPVPPDEIAIFETSNPPTIDGIPDEPEWYLLGDYPEEGWGDPLPVTEYNAQWGGLYDNDSLYLAVRVQDNTAPTIKTNDTLKLHLNDAAEFIIQGQDPNGNDDRKIIVDCENQANQSEVPFVSNGSFMDTEYHHAANIASGNVWSTEISFAWSDLGYAAPPASMKFDAYLDFAAPPDTTIGQRNWSSKKTAHEGMSHAGTINLLPVDTCDVDLINTAQVTVNVNPSANITPGNQEICGGASISLNGGPSGGNPPYQSHTWTGNTTPLTATNIIDPDFSTTSEGIYNLFYTVTDDLGCEGSDTVTIEVVEQANLNITDPTPDCPSVDITNSLVTAGSAGLPTPELISKNSWTASSDMGYHGDADGVNGTIDDNLSTYFHAQPRVMKTNYLTIDMQSTYNIGTIEIISGSQTFTNGACEIYFSDDNVNWTLGGQISTIASNSTETINFTGNSGRYIKLQMTTTIDKDYWDIKEINVYQLAGHQLNYWQDQNATIPLSNPDSVKPSGTYYITLGSGPCADTAAVNVTLNCVCPDSMIVDTIITPVTCPEGSDGAIFLTIGNGTPEYKFEWSTSNGSGLEVNNQNQTGLMTGDYQVIVTDDRGCGDTSIYTITSPDSIAISATITDASCEGDSDGGIVIDNVTGGNGAPYSYRWYDNSTNSSISGLAKGTYQVTVYDADNCPKIDSFEVLDGANIPNAGLTPTDTIICAGEPVTLTATGGASQSWADGSFPNPRTVSPKESTEYTAIISDVGCNATRTAQITVWPDPTVNLGSDRSLCEGNTLLLDAGSHDSYLWSNGQTTQTLEVSDSGLYHVTVANEIGCESRDTIYISFAPTPQANIVIQQGSTSMCQGRPLVLDGTSMNGSIYNWQPGGSSDTILSTTADITTTYHLTVFSDQGCEDNASVTINVTPAPTPTITGDASVFTETTGVIYELEDGIDPEVDNYTWTVNGGTIVADNTGSIEVDWGSNTSINSYVAVLAEDTPCSGTDTLWVTLTVPPPLRIYLSKNDISCNGYNDGSITVIFDDDSTGIGEGIPENYSYSWSNGSTTQSISSLSGGEYSVTVTDGRKTDSARVTITEPDPLFITGLDITNVKCHGDNTGSIEVNDTGGTPAYTYIYSQPGADTTTFQTSSDLIDSLYAGTYYITLQDNNQCKDSTSRTITQPSPIRVDYTIDKPICNQATDGSITLNPHGGTPTVFGFDSTYSYQWSTQDNFNDNVLEEIGPGKYTAIVIDSLGCHDTIRFSVKAERELCVFIPTAFSPNQDKVNDVWKIPFFGEYYPKGVIYVYDRWGELIFKSEEGYPKPWDGTYKGMPLPVDSYHFIIDLNNKKDDPITGQVTIIK
jgi:gliding motility-associated-like protein